MTVRFRVAAAMTIGLGVAVVAAGADVVGLATTPQGALGLLKAGNDRFVRNASTPPASLSVNRRQELAAGQHPTAMVPLVRRLARAARARVQRGFGGSVRDPHGR